MGPRPQGMVSLVTPPTLGQALSSCQSSQPRVKLGHWGIAYPHLGVRFLKDAMWKRDKKDFAREMGKLKRLKDQLASMEQDHLTEYQVRWGAGRGARQPVPTKQAHTGGRDPHSWERGW